MTVFKKTALVVAIASVSFGVNAELKAMDDQTMGEMTGQAGLTIDLETKYTIGEFMYKDAGSVFLNGISFGANENVDAGGFFDNVRVTLDIAGAGDVDPANGVADNYLETGFSSVRKVAGIQAAAAAAAGNAAEEAKFVLAELGQVTVSDAVQAGLIQSNATTAGPLSIEGKKTYGDGDLLIHVSYKDAWEKLGGLDTLLATDSTLNSGSATALGDLTFANMIGNGLVKGKDFNFSIDAIGLAGESFQAGDSIGVAMTQFDETTGFRGGLDLDGANTTVLISDLSINGFLGPVDIHIENNGNGFGPLGVGDADSKINWNTYVNVTDLDVYIDIAGVQITDLKINNVRGDVTDIDDNFSFGFAQSKREIYAVRNAAGFDTAGVIGAAGSAVAALVGTYQTNTVAQLDADGITDPVVRATAIAQARGAAVAEELGLDGVAINTHFKGDMEIGALSFGDTGTSIGELYWTDINSQTNWTISAH